MSRIPVAQLRLNSRLVRQPFLLREKRYFYSREGRPILRLILADRTGTIPGIFFDAPEYLYTRLEPGQGVEISGRVTAHRDRLQVSIDSIHPTELVHLEDFLPHAPRPLEEMESEFSRLRALIQNPDLCRLLDSIFTPDVYKAFVRAPGAKLYHHACLGGLLHHTLSVARITLTACELHPELDRDLALCLALLHDIGKIRAYHPTTFALTREGVLWSHLYIGAAMVQKAIDALEDFDPELRLGLVHGILAHHGTLDRGSPVVPMTPEAIAVHLADDLDSATRGALDHLEREDVDAGEFTAISRMHDTRLYQAPADL